VVKRPLDLLAVAGQLAKILERLGLPYALGGAVAQNFWGTVRATQDLDLLVSLPRIRFAELADALNDAGFRMSIGLSRWGPVTVEGMIVEERDRHLFAAYQGLVKVEFFLPFLPLQHSILRRAVKLPLGQRRVPITTAEDLVVMKMAFHREKDLRDVRAILWSQKGKLDLGYVREWAGRMLADERREELEAWIAKYHGV
jgi:hypothetical protein